MTTHMPLPAGHLPPSLLAPHTPTADDMADSLGHAPSARPGTVSSSHRNFPGVDAQGPDARPTSSMSMGGRPFPMRAKSDMGPRHPLKPHSDTADEAASTGDPHFKIRHGWDDQLNSEEYNHLLTSVSIRGMASLPET